jgi:hypothetical protein
MDIIEALVKRMIEDEDLIKGVVPRKVQKMLQHLENAKNSKLSPQQRQSALEQAMYIAKEGKEQKATSSAQSRASNLERLLSASKSKTASSADQRLAEIAARAGIKVPKEKEKEAPATPGSEATRTQIETSARRARRDPNAMPAKHYEAAEDAIFDAPTKMLEQDKPQKAKRLMTSKLASQANEALEQVNKLHGAGDIDTAHELYSAIPKNFLPKTLHDYNPDYMHYGVHPEMWSQITNPAHRQDMHNIHKQALSGELDNHPDYAHIIPKVKALKAPKPPA